MLKLLYILLSCFLPLAKSFSFNIYEDESLYNTINPEPLKVIDKAIAWEIFAKTQEREECIVETDGFENCLLFPTYPTEIQTLKDKNVIIMGYMFPLEASEKQQNFLIGPYPVSCPFHYHTSINQIIEVKMQSPLEFSYEPVILEGILSLDFNAELGVFYYLNEAAIWE